MLARYDGAEAHRGQLLLGGIEQTAAGDGYEQQPGNQLAF